MAVRVFAKDGFPLFAVAASASRAEAHETIIAACPRETTASGLARLERLLGAAANSNEREAPRLSLPAPLLGRGHLVTEFSRRRG
jgi:hypothetical protein